MNRIKLLVLAAMPALLFSQGGGSVPSSDDLTKEIRRLEGMLTEAEKHRNVAMLQLYLAPEFHYVDPNGPTLNKSQFLTMVGNPNIELLSLELSDVTVQRFGDAAIALMSYHQTVKASGRRFEEKGRTSDVWIMLDGRWQCAHSHSSLNQK